jgi:RNA polymerase sigma factor (sigma-70 family)
LEECPLAESFTVLRSVGSIDAKDSRGFRPFSKLRQAWIWRSVVSLEEAPGISRDRAGDILALDEALQTLAAIDPRKSQIVELRFFGGLSLEETADVLKVSSRTIRREWELAKVWLGREMSAKTTP